MKKSMALLLVLALMAAFTGCTSGQQPNAPAPTSPVEALSLPAPADSADPAVVDGVNGMGIEMLKKLYPDMERDNFMISPVSISLALSMTLNGAEGDTFLKMRDALYFSGMEMAAINAGQKDIMSILLNPDGTDKVKVEIANALWAREGLTLLEPFQGACREYYDADAQFLDFNDPEARETINAWVKEETHDMIESIIDEPIDPLTVLYLINTLFFDGKWTEPFDPERTRDGTFTKADGSTVTVPMMMAEQQMRVYYDPDGQLDCFGKSFGDSGRLEMLFIRPREDLKGFIEGLSVDQLDEMVSGSGMEEIMVNIPRFSYDTSLKLKDLLIAMGMEDAFDPALADLSAMGHMGGNKLHVAEVAHKTRIEVKEEGAKAAAVTSVEVATESAPMMIALDSPFLYLIRDTQTGVVLFMGVVEEPVEE